MDKGRKPKGAPTSAPIAEPRKPGIGMAPFGPIQVNVPKKKSWSNAQWDQARQFSAKKQEKIMRQQDAKRVGAEHAFMSKLPQARKAEIDKLSDMKLVSRPKRMPNADRSMVPAADAAKNYHDVMSDIGGFLDPKAPVRSTFNDGGPQMIQQFSHPQHGEVTRRVGIDVEPSSHVAKLAPHLNLQTQYDGKIQGGDLKDPHSPIRSVDPFRRAPLAPGIDPAKLAPERTRIHPLMGALTSDERRGFAERYVHSLGIPIKRE